MAEAVCALPGCRKPLPKGRTKWHSDECAALHRKREHKRLYGSRHRRLRRQWAPLAAQGRVACHLCGTLIHPGEPWELHHTEDGRAPAHSPCNRADGAAFSGRDAAAASSMPWTRTERPAPARATPCLLTALPADAVPLDDGDYRDPTTGDTFYKRDGGWVRKRW